MNIVRQAAVGAALVAVTSLSSPAMAALPVIDWSSLAQAIKQVQAWQQQYAQMQSQIRQLQSTYNSMTGDRGMAQLLPGNRVYLNNDWNSAMTSLNATALSIRKNQAVLTPAQTEALTPQMQAYVAQSRNLSASQQALGQQAYNEAARRVSTLQTLTAALAGKTDPKQVMDLTARIQAEQAGLANDMNQLQAVAQMTAAQGQAKEQMVNELRAQSSGSGNFPKIDTSLP